MGLFLCQPQSSEIVLGFVADSSEATGLKWATPVTGMTSLASGSLSGTQVVLSSISGSYKNLQLIIRGATWQTADASITLKANAITTGYDYVHIISYNDTVYTYGENNEAIWSFSPTNAQMYNNDQNIYVINLYDYASTNDTKIGNFSFSMDYSSGEYISNGAISIDGVDAAITSLTISNNGNRTFNGGTYVLYGVN